MRSVRSTSHGEGDEPASAASRRTVADKIRAVPASRRRASLRVDSRVRDRAQPGQGDVLAGGLDPDRPGGEPHEGVVPTAGLVTREPHPAAQRADLCGSRRQLPSAPGQAVQAGVERLLRALRPTTARHRV